MKRSIFIANQFHISQILVHIGKALARLEVAVNLQYSLKYAPGPVLNFLRL